MNLCVNNRKRIIDLSFIIVVTLCVCFIYLQNKTFNSHDINFHLYRLHGIVTGIQDGQFYAKIYPYVNNAYGYGTPLFYCDLFLYPFAFLYWAGVPIVLCFKLLIIFYIFLAILFIFITSSIIFKKYKYAAYISTIIYGFCNYFFYDIYVRSALGEVIAFSFIPLIILAMYYVFVERKNKWFLLGLSFALLLLSHNISFILYCVFFLISLVIFCIYYRKEKQLVFSCLVTIIKAVVFAICLSAFFLFPLLEQVFSDTFIFEWNKYSCNLSDQSGWFVDYLKYPFVSFEHFRSKTHGCFFNLGYVYYYLQFIYLYLLCKKKGNRVITYLFIISNIAIIFTFGWIPFTKEIIIINTIQFSFRFNIIAMPLLTIVLTYCICNLNKTKKLLITIGICLYCVSNMIYMHSTVKPFYYNDTDNLETIFKDYTDGNGKRDYAILGGSDYIPVMDAKVDFYYPEALMLKTINEYNEYYLVFINQNGESVPLPYERTGTQITFEYNSKGSELLMLPLTHYKGYKVYAIDSNNSKQELKVINPQRYKQVCFNTLKGNYKYVCHYDGTTIQHVSLIVSILTLVFILFSVIYRKSILNRQSCI